MDNLHTHGSLDVCRLVARWCQGPCEPEKRKKGGQRRAFLRDPHHRHVLYCTPKHGSWLNQAARFFRVVHRRFLARGSLTSATDFDRRLERFLQDHHIRHAHPYRWTDTGEPFVRDTQICRPLREQRQRLACLSPGLKPFEGLLYPHPPARLEDADLGTD